MTNTIKMCDCPEIAELWKPKAGDWYFCAGNPRPFLIGTQMNFDKLLREYPDVKRIYIPSLEVVLGWLKDIEFIGLTQNVDGHWCSGRYGFGDGRQTIAVTPLESLLTTYMLIIHNNTWDADKEAWV